MRTFQNDESDIENALAWGDLAEEICHPKYEADRPSWDDLFMQIAFLVAKRSKDPHTKVGAVLVKDKHILGIGYNGEPRDFAYQFDWTTSEKYDYVIHAELNCITNSTYFGNNIADSTMYLTLSPCKDCIKMLIQWQIKKVVYFEQYKDFDIVKKMADNAGIELIQKKL